MTIKFNTLQLKDQRVHFNKSFKFSGRILACHLGGCDSLPSQCSALCVWTSLVAQLVKNPPATQETPVQLLGCRSRGEGIGYQLQYSWAPLVAQMVKNLPAMWETWVRSLDWEDPPEGGCGNPFHYSCLENPHGPQHGVTKSQT